MFRISVAGLLILAFGGCTPTHFYVNKAPRTQGNLSVYRECQRTMATATGYDKDGFTDLKRRCLDTLEGLTTEKAVGTDAVQKIIPGSNCKLLDQAIYSGYRAYWYYLCE